MIVCSPYFEGSWTEHLRMFELTNSCFGQPQSQNVYQTHEKHDTNENRRRRKKKQLLICSNRLILSIFYNEIRSPRSSNCCGLTTVRRCYASIRNSAQCSSRSGNSKQLLNLSSMTISLSLRFSDKCASSKHQQIPSKC